MVVSKAQPTLTTAVPNDSVRNGDGVGDIAQLAGGADPQGHGHVPAVRPDDPQCNGPAAFVVAQQVHGNGSVESPLPAPTTAGTNLWVVVYSGDANNAVASTRCGDPHESVVVQEPPAVPAQPEEKPSPWRAVGDPAGEAR